TSSQAPGGIWVQGRYVFLAVNALSAAFGAAGVTLQVIDVADSSKPTQVAGVVLPEPPSITNSSARVTALAVSNNLALVASYLGTASSLAVVDVSNPASPQAVGRFDLLGTQLPSIDFEGRYAYLADASNGLRILDLISRSNPVQIAFFAEPGPTYSVFVLG